MLSVLSEGYLQYSTHNALVPSSVEHFPLSPLYRDAFRRNPRMHVGYNATGSWRWAARKRLANSEAFVPGVSELAFQRRFRF